MRVLVVDDEPAIRAVVRIGLPDVEVLEAADADAAMEVLDRELVSAVLLDVMMPRVSGFELLARLRQRSHLADLPVVMLSAKATEADHAQAYRAGADAYLTKPFDMEVLAALLDEVVTRSPRERATIRAHEREKAELLKKLERLL